MCTISGRGHPTSSFCYGKWVSSDKQLGGGVDYRGTGFCFMELQLLGKGLLCKTRLCPGSGQQAQSGGRGTLAGALL